MTDAAAWTDDEIVAKIREFTDINRLPPPASVEAADEFEAAVGCPMPPLLRRIYCEVANGGFGVGSGVVSLTDTGRWFSDEESLFSLHRAMSSASPDFEVNRPPYVMPLVTLGCGIWWCVDLNTPHGSIWGLDPNGKGTTPGTSRRVDRAPDRKCLYRINEPHSRQQHLGSLRTFTAR